MNNRLLGIYLNDQLAAGVLWRETARRAQRNNTDGELGEALARVATAITEDVETFERSMKRLSVRRNPLKTVLAIAAERGGRLKLNGRLTSYSPLSRFVELDFLAYGIAGKTILWQTCATAHSSMRAFPTSTSTRSSLARNPARRHRTVPPSRR